MGSGDGVSGTVYALVFDRNGILYAGGPGRAGGIRVNSVARWDGSSWSALGTGMNNVVRALAVDGNGNLYAGGDFTTAGGVPANRVARWDGTSWAALGDGMNDIVQALAVDANGNLYAGGRFERAGGVTVNYVARWDGSSWSALGGGTSRDVYSLAVDGSGDLYAGGMFTSAGGQPANHVARWDGSTWSPLGSGVSGYNVYALAVDREGNLYAGGPFSEAGGKLVQCIARWDGSTWSPLGRGMEGNPDADVYALAVDDRGTLYAGGIFTKAGGERALRIACWNGQRWSALGNGVESDEEIAYVPVYSLATNGSGNIYVGGYFTMAGGKSSRKIAHWYNPPPQGVDDGYTFIEDRFSMVAAPGVLGNDSDPDGEALVAAPVSLPLTGTLYLQADGSFDYNPAPNYFGQVTFTYAVQDSCCSQATATVVLTITNTPDPVVAVDDVMTATEDCPLVVPALGVLVNDLNVDHDPLTATLVAPPGSGVLLLNADGSFAYTPTLNWNGVDSFRYAAFDGDFTDTAAVFLTVTAVNDAPAAQDDAYATAEDNVLVVTGPGVLGNDSDVEGDPLTALLLRPPASGTILLAADGALTYTPDLNWNGVVTLTYLVSDGALTDVAAVTLTVSAVNDAPEGADDTYSTAEDIPLEISSPGVLGNDFDVEEDPLTALLLHPPASGTLSLAADGAFTYTPDPNWNGVDRFAYLVSDGALTDAVAVTLSVGAVNDAPVAADDAYTGTEDTPLVVAAPGLLENDRDIDQDRLAAVLASPPSIGTLHLESDGSFLYTPALNAYGQITFTYLVTDGALTDTAGVTLTLLAVNDAPAAVDDAFSTTEDMTLTVVAPGFLTNDSDVDGDLLTATVVLSTANGVVQVSPRGGFVYAPASNWNGVDRFFYVVSDGEFSATARVVLTVTAENDPPLAGEDCYTTTADTPLVIAAPGLLENDGDPEGDPLSAILEVPPLSGTIVLAADGSFIYTPALGFVGAETFVYRAYDRQLGSSPTLVTVTVLEGQLTEWRIYLPVVLRSYWR